MSVDREYRIKIVTTAEPRGARETKDALEDLGKAGKKANEEVAEKTGLLATKKKELKDVVKGLSAEFPELARVGRLALNPISFAVAGITGAFALWRYKVNELTRALGGVELPDIASHITSVNTLREAYGKLIEQIEAVDRKRLSPGADSDRQGRRLEQEKDQQGQMLAAAKEMELSQLESQKGTMGEARYLRARSDIEQRYSRLSIANNERFKRARLTERSRRAANLGISAAEKLRQAEGIKVVSAQGDDDIGEGLAKWESTAQPEIERSEEAARSAEEDLRGSSSLWGVLKGGTAWGVVSAFNELRRRVVYGWDKNALDVANLERSNASNWSKFANQRRAWKRGRGARDAARARQAGLYSEAGAEAAEAYQLEQSMPEEQALDDRDTRVGRATASMRQAAASYSALAEMEGIANSLTEAIDRSASSQRGLSVDVIRKLNETTREMDLLKQQIQEARALRHIATWGDPKWHTPSK